MPSKPRYVLSELRAAEEAKLARAAEAAEAEADKQAVRDEAEAVADLLVDADPMCPGLVFDLSAWMPRADLADAYYAAFPDSLLRPADLYSALREGECRESMRRGLRGFYGHRPEATAPAEAAPSSNVSGALRVLGHLTRGSFVGGPIAATQGGWISRADVTDAAEVWATRSGIDARPVDLFAALALLPGVEPGKRRGVRGFRGLTLAA